MGILLTLLSAEFLARLLPVTKGLYRTQNATMWPLHGYRPHSHYSYSLTWQMLFPNSGQTNNYGQLAPYDFTREARPIAVIGDSFVESQMNRYSQTLQGTLNAQFGGNIPVYSFGFAGNSLAEYLAVARMARGEFLPTALVILVIDNDVKESWQKRIGHRYFAVEESGITEEYWPLEKGGMAQRIRSSIGDSALYRYVQVNLGFTPDMVFKKHVAATAAQTNTVPNETAEVRSRNAIDYFLRHLSIAAGIPENRIFLVFDSDRERIYDPSRSPRQGVDSVAVQSYFHERARQSGYAIVDTSSVFHKHYAEHHRRFDFSPTDRHWNSLGHEVVALAVFEKLLTVLCGVDDRLEVESCWKKSDDLSTNGKAN
jgi:hypothetical protein